MTLVNKYAAEINRLVLFDDQFAMVVFDDKKCIEKILQIILDQENININEYQLQKNLKNLQGRSIIMDIFATNSKNSYNLEIEQKKIRAALKRARFHSSLIDAYISNPGDEFTKLHNIVVIFICKEDVFKKGLPIYHVSEIIYETNEIVDSGIIKIYVNGQYEDTSSDIGKLIHDFKETNPEKMYFKELAKRVRYLKEESEGIEKMCGVFEEFGKKRELQGEKMGRKMEKINTLLQLMNTKYFGYDNTWIEKCNSEQLKRGLDLILDELSYNEFKRKIFE